MKTKLVPKPDVSTETKVKAGRQEQVINICDLIIHNDDVNTFDFVIETLVDVCGHEYLQAVQCAHLIHNTGKCGVKRGTFDALKPICEVLLEKGLSATIE